MNLENIIDMQDFLLTLLYVGVLGGQIFIYAFLFALMTKYKDLEEVQKGNKAVSKVYKGKMLGLAIIVFSSAYHNPDLLVASVWAFIGFAIQMAGYWIFELVTRKFSVEDEIKNGNEAVAEKAATISLVLSIILAISII